MKKTLLICIVLSLVLAGCGGKKKLNPALNDKILEACDKGNLEEVKKLINDGADVNAKGSFDKTPLLNAYKHITIIPVLLDNGANIDAQDSQRLTALMLAIFNRTYDCAKLLINKGANVNLKSENGWTALMYACSVIKYEFEEPAALIKLLIAKGADKTVKNSEGKTPLDYFKESGVTNPELTKLLQ